jgi:hypothetical protein
MELYLGFPYPMLVILGLIRGGLTITLCLGMLTYCILIKLSIDFLVE